MGQKPKRRDVEKREADRNRKRPNGRHEEGSVRRAKSLVAKPSRAQPRRGDSNRSNSARGLERKHAKKWINHLKRQEEKHISVKGEATRLWNRLKNPTAAFPADPENGFPLEAISAAKRERRRAEESDVCGSTQTRRAIRAFEWSAMRYGDTAMEAERLLEYHRSIHRYIAVMMGLRGNFLASRNRRGRPRRDLEIEAVKM